ncbi:hypothetical protein CPB83DRAFT_138784 [Crepidotus variabilis]|uniref:Uncharacterized protein n=1 Tax=Crepidotus variabilis TaxID=179855 RepID=A0A9P6E426_9AGAR|nr:hypothetical protein CPB83DRAFT_138784 [Crepidotus variabilis]
MIHSVLMYFASFVFTIVGTIGGSRSWSPGSRRSTIDIIERRSSILLGRVGAEIDR